MRYLGYDVAIYKVFLLLRLCGDRRARGHALRRLAAEFASPTFMNIGFSISMVVWAAVERPLVAARRLPRRDPAERGRGHGERDGGRWWRAWQLIIGAIFLFVVLVMPRGLAGFIQQGADWGLDWLHKKAGERRVR